MTHSKRYLKSFISYVIKEIKKSEFDDLERRQDMESSHPIYTGRHNERDYFVKFPSNEIQTLSEFLAYKIYSLYDVKIPDSFSLVFDDDDGSIGISTESFSGGIYKGRRASDNLRSKFNVNVGSMFYIDAFLANWDAAKNVLVNFDKFNKEGELDYRMIDPGGALNFRARGERKDSMFTDDVAELDTLLDRRKTRGTGASFVYSGRDDQLARHKFKSVDWQTIAGMIDQTCEKVVADLNLHGRKDLVQEFESECDLVKRKLAARYRNITQKIS